MGPSDFTLQDDPRSSLNDFSDDNFPMDEYLDDRRQLPHVAVI